MKKNLNKKHFLLYVLFVIAVFHTMFFPYGPRVANDFHYAFSQLRLSAISWPYVWNTTYSVGMGEYAASVLWAWPLTWFTSLFFVTLGEQVTLGIFLLFLPIVFTGIWSRYLDSEIVLSKFSKTVITVFFLLNTYYLLLVDGGQFNLSLAYAYFPLSFFVWKSSLSLKPNKVLLGSLSVIILGFLDLRAVFLLGILIFVDFLFNFREFKNYLVLAVITSFVLLAFNVYWLLPALVTGNIELPATYSRASQVTFLSFTEFKNSLLLLQPHWYRNVFGQVTPVLKEFIFLPFLVFGGAVALLLSAKGRQKNTGKFVSFWFLVAMLGMFLTKGNNEPLGKMYTWLFTQVPGFSLFRDSSKFYFLSALAFSILIGITSEELVKHCKGRLIFRKMNVLIIPILIVLYLVVLIHPVYRGKMTGILSFPTNLTFFYNIAGILEKEDEFSRVLWIPTKAPLGFSSSLHPSVEASRMLSLRPFAIGVVGSYEQFNFLREAEFMGEIFKIAGIKYISYPYPDTRRETLKEDNIEYYYAFLDQLSSLPWIEKRITEPPVPLLKTKADTDHIFMAPNQFYVVGSDRIYSDLIEIDGFDLTKNALVFAEERPAVLSKEILDSNAKIITFEKGNFDVVASLVPKENFIFPAQLLDFDPDPKADTGPKAWWKRETVDFLWFRNFLQQKYNLDYQDFDYGGGFAIAEGSKTLSLKDKKFRAGDMVFARIMNSSRGGVVQFYQNKPLNGSIATGGICQEKRNIQLTGYGDIPNKKFIYDCADFFWAQVGKIEEDGFLKVEASGDINVINAIISISDEEINDIRQSIVDKDIIFWSKLSEEEKTKLFVPEIGKAEITYERVNPTHYRVKVVGLDSPQILAFSETYDPLWELNGQSSFPIYSLINGFIVEDSGEYDLYFTPQRYVIPGLIVSGVSLFTLLSLLLYYKLREKRTS